MSKYKNIGMLSGMIVLCLLAVASIAKPQELTPAPAEDKDAPWNQMMMNYVQFRIRTNVPITVDSIIYQKIVRIKDRSDYEYFQRCLHETMRNVKPGTYHFAPYGVRLRIVEGKKITMVDDNGVVKTPDAEYVLSPGSFLDLNNLMNALAATSNEYPPMPKTLKEAYPKLFK